jgi:ABC-type branched-subunit amino acid transport system substrate-binding protein
MALGKTRGAFLAGGAAAAVAGSARPARAAFGDTPITGTITIGVVGPFTGDSIRLAEQMANGVRAATDDTNLLRGALDKSFAITTFDDQDLIASGMINAGFACDNPDVVAVIGHVSGRITEAAMQTYGTNHMQVICPASSYDRLTAHGYGNLLRLQTKDSVEGLLAARRINATVKPKNVVVLYQDGDYGADVAAGFQAQMQADKVASTVLSFSWDKPDFAALTKEVLSGKPDFVFLAGITKDMGPIVPALQGAGYTGPFSGSQGFFDGTTIQKYGKAVEGLTVSSPMPPLTLAPGAFRIKNDFERKYGPLTPISAFSYAAAQIVIAVVRRVNASDRVAIERALNVTTPFDTLIGEISFGSDGDVQQPNAYFYTVTNGAWKYLGSAYPNPSIVK